MTRTGDKRNKANKTRARLKSTPRRSQTRSPQRSRVQANARDRLDDLREQWKHVGYKIDFDFNEFVSGITIVDQLIEREFKRFVTSKLGMSPAEVRILLALRRAGETQALRPTDLFKQLLVTSGAMSKQLDRLEERGCVRRLFNSESKRGWVIELTDLGRNLTDKARLSANSVPTMHAAFNALSAARRSEVLKILHQLVRDIQERTRLNPID